MIEHPHVELYGSRLVPFVRGTFVPVRRLWGCHEAGLPFEGIFERFPCLARAEILDAIAFVYDNGVSSLAGAGSGFALRDKLGP